MQQKMEATIMEDQVEVRWALGSQGDCLADNGKENGLIMISLEIWVLFSGYGLELPCWRTSMENGMEAGGVFYG